MHFALRLELRCATGALIGWAACTAGDAEMCTRHDHFDPGVCDAFADAAGPRLATIEEAP